MTKVSIIGAGNVGATLAMRIAEADLADVVLIDIAEGVPIGKALDLTDAAPIAGHSRKITGAKDYKAIEGSKVAVVTAGFPRTPGMSREELFLKNSSIVKEAAAHIKKFCPDAVIIIVTNPLDAMSYVAYKESGFPRERVLGMAGVLDTARFIALLTEQTGAKHSEIETYIIGSHGDTMVAVLSHTKIKGKPISSVLEKDKLAELLKRTKNRGGEIVSFLKSGSAYYAPSAAAFLMVKAILKDTKEVLCVSCFLDGEYGLKDIFIGVPARIGKNGMEEIVALKLSKEEEKEFKQSADIIRKTIHK